jgi:hypothetical protein
MALTTHLFESKLSCFLPGTLKDLNKPCYWCNDAVLQYTNRKNHQPQLIQKQFLCGNWMILLWNVIWQSCMGNNEDGSKTGKSVQTNEMKIMAPWQHFVREVVKIAPSLLTVVLLKITVQTWWCSKEGVRKDQTLCFLAPIMFQTKCFQTQICSNT